MELQQGKTYIGTVEGYSSEGNGIVKLDGAVIFVPRAVRGETIYFQITHIMRNAAVGEMIEILSPSPQRIKPDCPYHGTCGGCNFRHISYEEELWAKRQRVQDALERLGGTTVRVEEIIGAKNPANYRNKSQYVVGIGGMIGFYRAGSHQITPVERCLLQPEVMDRTAQAVGNWIRRYQISIYDASTGKGLIRHIYIRVNQRGESLCCVVVNGKQVPQEPELVALVCHAVPETVGVVLNVQTRPGNVILGDKYRVLWGQDFLMDTLCGVSFKLSVPSFYQVCREQAEILYGKVLEFAGLMGKETILDLYCGIGTITLFLAKRAKRVLGVEVVPEAVRNAEENAVRNSSKNVEFFCGDALEIAAKLEWDGLQPDVVIVDPPRKGLAANTIHSIVTMKPDRVVYVSCDPGSLGRDVRRFSERGYQAVRAVVVDMFARTKHVESVVLMSRVEK